MPCDAALQMGPSNWNTPRMSGSICFPGNPRFLRCTPRVSGPRLLARVEDPAISGTRVRNRVCSEDRRKLVQDGACGFLPILSRRCTPTSDRVGALAASEKPSRHGDERVNGVGDASRRPSDIPDNSAGVFRERSAHRCRANCGPEPGSDRRHGSPKLPGGSSATRPSLTSRRRLFCWLMHGREMCASFAMPPTVSCWVCSTARRSTNPALAARTSRCLASSRASND